MVVLFLFEVIFRVSMLGVCCISRFLSLVLEKVFSRCCCSDLDKLVEVCRLSLLFSGWMNMIVIVLVFSVVDSSVGMLLMVML